jgi:hypothetical protein
VNDVGTVARILLEVVGGISLVLAPFLAYLRGSRIEIRAKDWSRPEPWHFATVEIRNPAPPRWLLLASRETAVGCRVTARFYRQGEPVTTSIPCRWSDRPEPIRLDLVDPRTLGAPPGPPLQIGILDPTLIPASQVYDLPSGGRWEEVAVAVLRDGEAHGWGADSYRFNWGNPDWRLERGVYDVEVRVDWLGKSKTRWFRLEYLSDDLPSFRLTDPQS